MHPPVDGIRSEVELSSVPCDPGDDVVTGLLQDFDDRLGQPAALRGSVPVLSQLGVGLARRPDSGQLGIQGIVLMVSLCAAGRDEDRLRAETIQERRRPQMAVKVPHVEAVQADGDEVQQAAVAI